MGNKLAYVLIAAAFAALIALNPGEDHHRRTFMDYAHKHFFELPAGYRAIYEQLRPEGMGEKPWMKLRYSNFLLFSTLGHTQQRQIPSGEIRPERRPLTIGVLGLVFPLILEPTFAAPPRE